jgi:tryptophan-rich sensory protein
MNKETLKNVLIIVGAFLISLLIAYATGGQSNVDGVAMIGFLIGLIIGFIGFIFIFNKSVRNIGAGLLIGSLLVLIIGIGVCSAKL